MKITRTLLLACIACFFFAGNSFAQDIPEGFMNYKLEEKEDYAKAEPMIIELADYLLNEPVKPGSNLRDLAKAKLLQWMTGTPDYSFDLHVWATEISKKEPELLMILMASMTRVGLSNPEKKDDKAFIQIESANLLATYIANADHNVKVKGYVKKFMAAHKAGTLAKFIGQ
ncbi:MAG: hypothetical protein AB8F95_06705 [Bacteroidia bacterium]